MAAIRWELPAVAKNPGGNRAGIHLCDSVMGVFPAADDTDEALNSNGGSSWVGCSPVNGSWRS